MSNLINNNYGVNNVNTGVTVTVPKNISYRGRSDYERTPESDSFESENKTGKTVGIVASAIAVAALVLGGICLHKGGKALEGAEEAEKTFGKKLKKGWEKLWHKGEKTTKNGTDEADVAAREAEEQRLAKEAEEQKLAKEAEEQRLAKEAEEQKLAKEAEEQRLAKEAEEQKLAKEAEEQRLAREAEEQRLAKEAEEQKAAKIAKEKELKVARKNLEQEKILPEAKEIIADRQKVYGHEVARCTRLYNQAKEKGFKSLKGDYTFENGVHTITHQRPESDIKYVYTTNDLKKLEEVTCYRQGEKVYEANFSQACPSNELDAVEIFDIARNEDILFADVLEKDGGSILNWRDCNRTFDYQTEDVLHHIDVLGEKYQAGYWKQGGLWTTEWTKM